MVAHERRDVRAQPLAGAQASSTSRASCAPRAVVADEGHAPVRGANCACQRLGGIVQQSAPAQRLARGSSRRRAARAAASRPARGAAPSASATSPGPGPCGRGQLDRAVEHLERVAVDIGVMEAVLLDATQRLELGQHDGRRAQLAHQLDAARVPRARRGSCAAPRTPAPRRPRESRLTWAPRAARASASGSSPSSTATRTRRSTRRGSGSNAAGRPCAARQPAGPQDRRAGRSARPPRAARRSR